MHVRDKVKKKQDANSHFFTFVVLENCFLYDRYRLIVVF